LSNLAYLLPVIVIIYKLCPGCGQSIDPFIGAELIVVFLVITLFTSTSFHMCRDDIRTNPPQEDDDKDLNCKECNFTTMSWTKFLPGASHAITYQTIRLLDHFIAWFSIILVLVNIIPLKDNIKQMCIILSIIWLLFFLPTCNDIAAVMPVLALTTLFFIFWITVRKGINTLRNIVWGMAVITCIVSLICYTCGTYWLSHSCWHVFGAITVTLLLMQTAGGYENVNLTTVRFGPCMEIFFKKLTHYQ